MPPPRIGGGPSRCTFGRVQTTRGAPYVFKKGLELDKADVNALDGSSKLTPLHRAARYGHVEVVALLLGNKADRSAKSWDGKIPLDFAREQGDERIIRLLEKQCP